MTCLRVGPLLAATMVAAFPTVAAAQFPPAPPPPGARAPTVQERWPDPPKPPQTARPQAPAEPLAPQRRPAQRDTSPAESAARTTEPKPPPRPPANVLACGGVFAKDSTHLKLALKYDARNVVYGQVDGPDGSKLNASILFPNDPLRRLEILWNNEGARSDTSVIAINGKSQWVAPKGLKLGLSLAAIEKINGRPFKLTGFDQSGFASVIGWEGGALSALPGGCKVGMRLAADAKAPANTRGAVAGDQEHLSNEAGVRALKPTIGEILVGY